MEHIKKQLQELLDELNETEKSLIDLEKNELIQKYLELQEKIGSLKTFYSRLKKQEYCECNHFIVYSQHDDIFEGSNSNKWACVKCGLNNDNLKKIFYSMPEDQQIKLNNIISQALLSNNFQVENIEECYSMYQKIANQNPDLDEDALIMLFKEAIKEKQNKSKIK